jgi:hypothetical protein
MRWKSLTVLAVIFAALAGFYYVYEIRLAPGREKAEQAKGRLWSVEPKDVEEVVFKRAAETVRLKRQGEDWALLAPVKARGDKGAVNDIVTNLVTTKVDRQIDPKPANLSEFGLDPPAAEITVKVKDRAEPLVLLLGGKNPTGVWVYGKEPAKPTVFVLSELALRDATKPVSELREKTILAFTRQDVTQVDITHGSQEFSVALGEGANEWRMVKPRSYRADRDRLFDFMDKLQSGKVKEFVSEAPKSLTQYGFDQPTRVTLWTGKDKERTARSLLLGKFDAEKKGVYAVRQGESGVFLLGEEIWNVLPKSVADLRDKTVIEYDREKVTKLEVDSPKGKMVLARDGEKWQISEPEKLKADDGEVNGFLWKLKELKAQSFLADDPAAAGRYLRKPEVRVSVWQQGAQAPKTLALAPAPPKRDGKTLAYAAVLGQGPVALVDSAALGDLARSLTDLRDHSLLPFFEPKDVKRVHVKIGDQALLVERKGDTEWQLLEPKKGKARDARITDLLYAVRGLKWSELVSSRGERAAQYGFDRPSLELTLWKADGAEIGTLIVGKKDASKIYLKTKASQELYSVDSRQIGDLPKGLDDLLS